MSERMRMTVLALLTGLYAAAAVILAPIDLTEPEQFFGYFKFAAIGIFLAPPALLAFCAVLGPGRWTIRLPLIAWLTCLLGLLLAYGARRGDFGYGLSSDPAEWISFCFGGPLAEYLILLPPLALLRFVRSWRLQAPNIDAAQGCQTMASSPSAVMPRADSQFTVRSLLIWTLAAASILAGLRWVLAEKGLGGNTWGEIVLAGLAQGAMLGILLTLAALPVLSIAWLFLAWQRRLLPRLALATVTAAGIAAVLAWQWSMDHDTGTLLVVAVIEAGVIGGGLASVVVIRTCGYRLMRRPRGYAAVGSNASVGSNADVGSNAAVAAWPQRRVTVALSVLVVAAIALACCVPARLGVWRQAGVVRHWAARGLEAMLDDRGVVVGLHGDADQLTEEDLRHLADELPDLTTLNFESLRDSQLAALTVPAGLETLCISDFRFTDKGLARLGRFRQLRELKLRRTSITDAGLPHIAVLDELFHLDLALTDVTDDGLAALMQCKELRAVDLSLTAVTEAGARRLSEALPEATIIVGACDNMLSTAALGHRGAVRLERLHACGKYQCLGPPRRRPMPAAASVSDAGLKLLDPNMGLKHFDLRAAAVTDAGLPALFSLKTLVRVDLRGTAVTEAGCQRLAAALPDCEILR